MNAATARARVLVADRVRQRASSPALAACGLLALAWVVTLTIHPWSDESVGDLGSRRAYATLLLDGAVPYRDFRFEYPPLAAPLIALPGLVGTGADAYWSGFALVTFGIAVCVVLLTGRLARVTGGDERRAMIVVALSPLLLGAVVRTHVDLAPAALVLGALAAILARRPALGFALLGVGVMTKAFPLVVAPVALAWLVGQGERRSAARGAAALGATVAAFVAVALALSASGAVESARYQLERPIQVESSPASALLGLEALGMDRVARTASHGSTGLSHPLDGAVTAAFVFALVGAIAALSLLAMRRAREPDPVRGRALVLAALAAVASFAAFGKVLSPQFLLWVVALPALAVAWRLWAVAATAAAAAALTLVEFPGHYLDLAGGDAFAVMVTALRNCALIATIVLAALALSRRPQALPRGAGRRSAPARPAPPR